MHPYIEAEVNRLFRTHHFVSAPSDKKPISNRLKITDMYDLKHKFGMKLPGHPRSKCEIHLAAKGRSPLLTSIFPAFDKFEYHDTGMLNRGFEHLTLNLPAEVLISNKPLNKKSTSNDSRPDTSAAQSNQT